MPVTVLTSVQNPRVKRLLKLRKPRERRAAGLLIAEGRREVERASGAGLDAEEVWVCPALYGNTADQVTRGLTSLSPRLDKTKVIEVSEAVLKKAAYHRDPEGILGVFQAPRWSLDTLPPTGPDALYLVAVGTEKPGNLGAMVRTAAAAGCDAVLAVGPVVDVFNPNAIRNSTGAVFTLPTVVVEDDEAAREWLKRRGIRVVAAVANEHGRSCFQSQLARPTAIAVGPEHAGLNDAWVEASDLAVTIPMAGTGVDSLNASNAAGILLFECVRQRLGADPKTP